MIFVVPFWQATSRLFTHEGRTMWSIVVRLAQKSERCERFPWQRGEAGMRRDGNHGSHGFLSGQPVCPLLVPCPPHLNLFLPPTEEILAHSNFALFTVGGGGKEGRGVERSTQNGERKILDGVQVSTLQLMSGQIAIYICLMCFMESILKISILHMRRLYLGLLTSSGPFHL